ncbi:MAG: MBL fold metallo-hydrolase [Clostridia bacterium]|nr:MBL fold metallo-hydrolase [Clostridia bacterium]
MIKNVGTKLVNNWLISCENGFILIDTGFKGGYDKFCKRLAENGLSVIDIKYIVVTHMHSSRVGFLKKLLVTSGAKLIYNGEDKIRLESGKNNMRTYVSRFDLLVVNKIASAFVEKTQCFPAIFKNDFLDAKDQPLQKYGLEFVLLQGHSEHDTCLKMGDKLFVGELCDGGITSSSHAPMWIWNKYKMLDSWREITKLGVEEIYPAHGKKFSAKELPTAIAYWLSRGVFRL